jgi:hypothetical protein
LLAKTDIEAAFRLIPIHPDGRDLLGFKIEEKFYYDKTLPMGLSLSCRIFETFSHAVHWIAEKKLQIPGVAHILDDFLFVCGTDMSSATSMLDTFLSFAADIAMPINHDKTVQPCTTLSFVGIEIDTELMEVRLPQDKLHTIRDQLQTMSRRKKATLRELQSLIGLLNFACSVVIPGRPFLRRIIDLTLGMRQPHHFKRLTNEARADLKAWFLFVESFNGKSMFLPDRWETSVTFHLLTDASNLGFVGYLNDQWFSQAWPEF